MVVALTGNILAITFGAVGTPLIIGFEDVVFGQDPTETGTAAYAVVQNGGYESVGAYVAQIGVWAAVIHAIVGIAIPFIGVAMMTRFFGEERSLKPAIEVIPLTLFAWASFVIPYLLTAYFLGPTFPGLLGAMVGLLVVGSTLRAGYFLPEEEWDFGRRSSGRTTGSAKSSPERAWAPPTPARRSRPTAARAASRRCTVKTCPSVWRGLPTSSLRPY